MTVQLTELSVWCRVTYTRHHRGWKIGPLRIGARATKKTAEIVRVYPQGIGLPERTSYEDVVTHLLNLGYKPIDEEVLHELVASHTRSNRRGYVVAPLTGGGFDFLMTFGGFINYLDHALLPQTVEHTGYSVIVAR